MKLWHALLLGIVQGLCEFLPVSSSGHLLLTERLLGVGEDAGGAFFTVMLHVATLVAVCIVYRKQLLRILKKPFQKLTYMLVIATLPTVAIALLFKKVEPFESFYDAANEGLFLGVSFLVTAALLLITDYAFSRGKKRAMKEMTYVDAVLIGCMQAVGVLPGISRSGATVTGAAAADLSKDAAADFSFLMSVPAILGSLVLAVKDAMEAEGGLGVSVPCLLAGMLVAGVTGYFAVRFMLKLIKQRKLWGFSVYTAVLGVLVLIIGM